MSNAFDIDFLFLRPNKGNNLPNIKIHRRNKIFNDIVEMSKLIPDNTEINKEYKKNNYDDYMRMKELKVRLLEAMTVINKIKLSKNYMN